MRVVLHVFGTMDVGGAELRTLDLMRELAPRGIDFHFLTLSGRAGALDDEIYALGGTIHCLPLTISFPLSFLRLLRRLRPDVVDSHVATFSGILLLGAKAAGVKRRIAHFRSDGDGHPDRLRRRVQRYVMRWLIRRCATHIVGVSPSALTYGYRSDWAGDRRARVVVNGVSPFSHAAGSDTLRDALGISANEVLLLHVGRPSPEKNRVRTVHVLHELRKRGVDAHLALVGGAGPDNGQIEAAAERLGMHDFLHELGVDRDPRLLMSQADILLLTSVREGLPGVVLECLSTGTPVVAADLPGVQFIAAEVPAGVWTVGLDQPDSAWADAVQMAAAADAVVRARLRDGFADSRFSFGRAAEAHLELYSRGDLS